MKHIRKRLTYANVVSSLALFLALTGATAFAATQLGKNTVGAKQLKKNAVVTSKIKKNAVTTAKIKTEAVAAGKIKASAVGAAKLANGAVGTDKLADAAVTTGKLADGSVSTDKVADASVTTGKLADSAVSTGKLADSSVTRAKLDEAERSEGFLSWEKGTTSELATGLLGNYATASLLISRSLNPGLYMVTASTEFINSAIEPRSAICRLFDDGTEIGAGSTVVGEVILVSQGTVTITGVSDGGTLALRCRTSGNKVFGFDRKITAVRVGSVG